MSAVRVAPEAAPDLALADDLAAAALVLARRLHAGGTLWCSAPAWPHHAQHVAVEFVHPVVVGTRALPAVALAAQDAAATARANAAAGDVLVLIGQSDDPVVRDLLRRAPAWGVTTVWVGAGARPVPGLADAVLWVDDETAPYDGRLILLYHLLWELTHVCLGHEGLLRAPSDGEANVCVTCSDEGRLAEVAAVTGTTAQVRTADGFEDVDLALVGEARPEDLLVVHAGMAITVLQA